MKIKIDLLDLTDELVEQAVTTIGTNGLFTTPNIISVLMTVDEREWLDEYLRSKPMGLMDLFREGIINIPQDQWVFAENLSLAHFFGCIASDIGRELMHFKEAFPAAKISDKWWEDC